MNRETFLNELMAGLTQLGPVEQRQVADYYNELIFDGVENGKPEEEIIAGFGAPEEIAYKNGWITKDKLMESARRYGKSPYGEHLKRVAEGRLQY